MATLGGSSGPRRARRTSQGARGNTSDHDSILSGSAAREGSSTPPIVRRYVAAISLVGIALLAALVWRGDLRNPVHAGGFWLFSLFVVLSELFPISVQREGEVDQFTTSTTFAFALMLAYGTSPAAVALTAASAVSDGVNRKPAWKIAFNVAQYTISIGAAGFVYHWVAPSGALTAHQLPAMVVSAALFFVLNTTLTGVGVALSGGTPLLESLRRDLLFQVYTAPALLAMSPIVVLAADVSLWFVPLLAIPIGAVYWGATKALENLRLVERLQGSLEHMTELNRVKDDFVAVVSHELRTPLTSIQGYIKTLLGLGAELDAAQHRAFLEAADRQSERLRRLIEQTLVVARLESHVEPLMVSAISLPTVANNVVDELRARSHGHTFDLRFSPDVPTVQTDEGKVHQILSNLVENALKYSPPDTRITVRVEPGVNGVLAAVEDEGPGIPVEEQAHVFDRFYQVDQSTTRAVGGTGLGLYICRKMADQIGARLWLERSQPSGSVFCLFLGQQPAASDEPEANHPATGAPPPPDGQSMTASV